MSKNRESVDRYRARKEVRKIIEDNWDIMNAPEQMKCEEYLKAEKVYLTLGGWIGRKFRKRYKKGLQDRKMANKLVKITFKSCFRCNKDIDKDNAWKVDGKKFNWRKDNCSTVFCIDCIGRIFSEKKVKNKEKIENLPGALEILNRRYEK